MSGFCRSHRAVMRNSYSRSRYSIGDSSEHPSYWDDDDRVEPTLTHLEHHGYEFDEDDREWWILASSVKRLCRRDHKDGTIKAGQRYVEQTYRYITDNPDSADHRKSRRETTKTVLCDSCNRAAWRCKGGCQQ